MTPSASDANDPRLAADLYRMVLRIRRVEERIRDLYAAGRMPGFIHLSIGQEAVAAGGCAPLRHDDVVTSTHRGHGHYLAKGGSLRGLVAELYGKATGCCRGKGGSMHIADVAAGYLGANGVLTAGLPLACGAALSAKLRGTDQVCVAFFGDGAANRGPFHEAVNLAAVWGLAKGLRKTAIRDDDPVIVFEQRSLYRVSGPVPDGEHLVPLGRAEVKRAGRDVTVNATARMVQLALEAAGALARDGISVEVVDPRSLVPLDRDTLVASVARTHRVVIAEEGPLRGGVGGHLAWVVMEAAFDELDAPVERVASANVPVPFAPVLEAAVSPQAETIRAAVRRTLGLGA